MRKGDYIIVRTLNAGVFAGKFAARPVRDEIELTDARRLWLWAGAASLSELATRGTSEPNKCKFPVSVSHVTLLQVIEILTVTKAARNSIEEVPVWTA